MIPKVILQILKDSNNSNTDLIDANAGAVNTSDNIIF